MVAGGIGSLRFLVLTVEITAFMTCIARLPSNVVFELRMMPFSTSKRKMSMCGSDELDWGTVDLEFAAAISPTLRLNVTSHEAVNVQHPCPKHPTLPI